MGKYACVTGADRGLGLALSKELLEMGCTVFAGQYLQDWGQLEHVRQQYPERLILIPLDVGSDESVKSAALEIAARTDKIDILVNNAAIVGNGRQATILDELDFEDMLQTFNIVALGSLRITNALISLLLKSSNKLIVNISSEAGSIGQSWRTNFYGYCMGKSAMNMHSTITYNSIRELGGHVLDLHPGWMQGWISGTLNTNADLTPEYSAQCLREIIERQRIYQTNEPAFLDYIGNRLKW